MLFSFLCVWTTSCILVLAAARIFAHPACIRDLVVGVDRISAPKKERTERRGRRLDARRGHHRAAWA